MKKVILSAMVLLMITLMATAFASQRVVVAEDFTGTWCQYCPAAANGLDQLHNEAGDSLVVLAFHYGDPYQTTETYNRIVWYGDMIPGYPTVIFDGLDSIVGSAGSGAAYNNYAYYRPVFDAHKAVPSPFELTMGMAAHDLSAGTGTVDVKIKNTNSVSEAGILHFVVLERNIPVSWQGMEEIDFVVRDMVPDENGEAINIPAGDSLLIQKNFSIDPSWVLGSCQFVAFIQRSNKEIIQGSQLYGPFLAQQSYGLAEIGDGDGYYEPGESLELSVEVKERYAPGTGAVVEATSADTFVTINNGLWDIGNMLANEILDNNASPFEILIKPSANMPEGHKVDIGITKKIYSILYNDTVSAYDTIKFTVGSPNTIYYEDFESGLGGWTISYVGNASKWDTTDSDYHSANNCITDSKSGSYAASSINRIQMAAGIDLSNYSYATLALWEKYFTDETGDECRIRYSTDGGSAWSELVKYSDTCNVWTKRTGDITPFCGTATDFRIRFEFFSNSSITADGWYVDDVMIMGYTKTGVAGKPEAVTSPAICMLKGAYPNPASGKVNIGFQLKAGARTSLKIYNIAGELVRTLVDSPLSSGEYDLRWDGRDSRNRAMPSGVYFYQLDTDGQKATGKLTFIR